jgi:hypothetical protein
MKNSLKLIMRMIIIFVKELKMKNEHSQPISTNHGPLTVRKCGCGGVHLCLGGISINLAKDTVHYLSEKLNAISDEIKQEENEEKRKTSMWEAHPRLA